jgi:hypothetical protein
MSDLAKREYVNVLRFSTANRTAVGLRNTKRSTRRLTVNNGVVSTERDDDDDDALTSTWYAFRSSFLFMVLMMTKLLSRRDEVDDWLEHVQAPCFPSLDSYGDSALLLKFAQASPKTPTDRDARGADLAAMPTVVS